MVRTSFVRIVLVAAALAAGVLTHTATAASTAGTTAGYSVVSTVAIGSDPKVSDGNPWV